MMTHPFSNYDPNHSSRRHQDHQSMLQKHKETKKRRAKNKIARKQRKYNSINE